MKKEVKVTDLGSPIVAKLSGAPFVSEWGNRSDSIPFDLSIRQTRGGPTYGGGVLPSVVYLEMGHFGWNVRATRVLKSPDLRYSSVAVGRAAIARSLRARGYSVVCWEANPA